MDFLKVLLRLPLLILRGIYWIVSRIVGDVSWASAAAGCAPRVRALQRSGRSHTRADPDEVPRSSSSLLIRVGRRRMVRLPLVQESAAARSKSCRCKFSDASARTVTDYVEHADRQF